MQVSPGPHQDKDLVYLQGDRLHVSIQQIYRYHWSPSYQTPRFLYRCPHNKDHTGILVPPRLGLNSVQEDAIQLLRSYHDHAVLHKEVILDHQPVIHT